MHIEVRQGGEVFDLLLTTRLGKTWLTSLRYDSEAKCYRELADDMSYPSSGKNRGAAIRHAVIHHLGSDFGSQIMVIEPHRRKALREGVLSRA